MIFSRALQEKSEFQFYFHQLSSIAFPTMIKRGVLPHPSHFTLCSYLQLSEVTSHEARAEAGSAPPCQIPFNQSRKIPAIKTIQHFIAYGFGIKATDYPMEYGMITIAHRGIFRGGVSGFWQFCFNFEKRPAFDLNFCSVKALFETP